MEKEIELTEMWRAVRRRLPMILILTFVLVTLTALVTTLVIQPTYEAKSSLLVQLKKSDSQNPWNDVMANQELVKTYGEIIKSRQIAEDVIQKQNLTMTTEELLENVEVSAANESLVTTITVTNRDHGLAVAIANGFAETFQQKIGSIMKVDNVSVLDRAKTVNQPEPVQPKPLLYSGVAAVFGLFLGIALTFLLEYLDQTVKSEGEVEQLLGLPVLGVIADMDRVKRDPTRKEERSKRRGAAHEVEGNAS